MTNRERVIASLNHEQPDRCPYVIEFTQKAKAAMDAAYGDSYLLLLDNAIHKVTAVPGRRAQWIAGTVFQDEWGVQWERSLDPDIGNVCNRMLPARSLCLFQPPDPWAEGKFATMEAQIAAGAGKFIRLSIAFTLFERAWSLRGMENIMLDMMEAPEFVDELLDAICDVNVALIEQAVTYPIDAVHLPDDWGDQRGVMMGPRLWERFIRPRVQRMFDAARAGGKYVTIHCCGKVQELFPTLIDMGLDLFNPFQPEVMDPYEMKREFGDRLSFWGGVSTQRLLPFGTPDEVRAEVRRLKREIGKDGGYVISPAHAVPGDAKPGNVMALIEAVNE